MYLKLRYFGYKLKWAIGDVRYSKSFWYFFKSEYMVASFYNFMRRCFRRFMEFDWGEVDEDIRERNNRFIFANIKVNDRLKVAYPLPKRAVIAGYAIPSNVMQELYEARKRIEVEQGILLPVSDMVYLVVRASKRFSSRVDVDMMFSIEYGLDRWIG